MNSEQNLIDMLFQLKRTSVGQQVAQRIQEFHQRGQQPPEILFQEMCFCILTANCSADRCISIQQKIGSDFLSLSEQKLAERLQSLGYRFHHIRAHYICLNRKHYQQVIQNLSKTTGLERREQLIKDTIGFGYKEASHFLRNIGYDEYAIVDFHILDLLKRYHIIKKPKASSRKNYLQIEQALAALAALVQMSLAELDLYLWYVETGKILK